MTSTAANTQAAPALPVDALKVEQMWKDRIGQAREYRRQFEPTWLSDLAFAAGQQWLAWDDRQKRMLHLSDLDPRYRDRELYTADRINEQLQAALGELSGDDDRPQLLVAQKGHAAEQQQEALNAAAAHGWDHEWKADDALTQARRLCLVLGLAAIRVRFDPTLGPVLSQVPHADGQPLGKDAAFKILDQGGQLEMRDIHEGRTVWEPLSAFNLLFPPGVPHEDSFPWEIVMRPMALDKVQEEYGAAAAGLKEDHDIASIIGLATNQNTRQSGETSPSTRGRLRDHVWLYTCYERPSQKNPRGRTTVLASNQVKFLTAKDELPSQAPDGSYRSGLHYFHWWRQNDRPYSRSFIQPMKDPQRLINRRETQNAEIIDRGMPKVFTKEGALVHDPQGLPLENIELSDTSLEPHFFAGIGPGEWMYKDIDHHIDNLAHASTLSALRLGENPTNVHTYAQLAMLNENESSKRSATLVEHKRSIAGALEDSIHNIRRYWPDGKMMLIEGPDGSIGEQTYQKSQIPDFYVTKVAKGAPQPRSQAAELTKIDAVWQAATATGVANGNERWVRWYADSLAQGMALDLPDAEPDAQAEMAHFENTLMVEQHEQRAPAEYDLSQVHVPIHRLAQDQARASGDEDAYQLLQQHIAAHVQMATLTRKFLRVLDPADTQDVDSDQALDEDQAIRENQALVAGTPMLNPEAYRDALQALQHGTNPETGQPVAVDQAQALDIHGILQRASLKPTYVENLLIHMDRHGKVIKSALFQTWPQDVRDRFITHFNQTRDLWLSLPTMPDKVAAPKVTLQLRESVGPTTTQQILHRAGVPEADAQTLASEPPMAEEIEQIKGVAQPPPSSGQ